MNPTELQALAQRILATYWPQEEYHYMYPAPQTRLGYCDQAIGVYYNKSIVIDVRYHWGTFESTIAHELIHHYQETQPYARLGLTAPHGPDFLYEAKRINIQAGRMLVTTRSSYLEVSKLKELTSKLIELCQSANKEAELAGSKLQKVCFQNDYSIDHPFPDMQTRYVKSTGRVNEKKAGQWFDVAYKHSCLSHQISSRGIGCNWYISGRQMNIQKSLSEISERFGF